MRVNLRGSPTRISVAATVHEIYSAPSRIMIPEQQVSMA